MHPNPLDLAFALAATQSMAACLLLIFWLGRHHRVPPPAYGGPRRHGGTGGKARTGKHPKAKEAWVIEQIIRLAAHRCSCRKVETILEWTCGFKAARRTFIAKIIRTHAQEIVRLRREIKRRKPVFIPVNHTWTLDLTLIRSPFGFTFTVLAILDAGSRKLLRIVVLPRKCVYTIMAHVLLAAAEFGPPEVVRSDNEAMFTSRPWLAMLKAMSIRPRRGPPLQPWHNGRIERFWGTLKAALRAGVFDTAQALQATLDRFARFYNEVRPHQALTGLTPEEAWQRKTMAEVQLAHAQGHCDRSVDELLQGFHVRC